MAINWNLYNTRLNINGTTKRERDLYCLQNKITNNLPNSLSCKTVKINGADDSLNFTETEKGYDIQSLPNETFSAGDYVEYKTLTYLVTKVKGDKEVYTSGSMEECTYTLKFQSSTGTILSYPCIVSETSSLGIDENNTISTKNGISHIKLPFDENTKLIGVDKRFFLDKVGTTTYKVTNVNNTEFNYGNKGLIELTLQQDIQQTTDGELPKDRPDLGICNYFEPIVEPVPPVIGETSAVISASGDLVIGNSNYITLTPTFYNVDSTINNTITSVWVYTYPIGYQNSFIIESDGNNIKIKITEVYELINKSY